MPFDLQAVQERFFALVTAPEGVAKGLATLGLSREDIEQTIRSAGSLTAVERLDIYANMYFFRILDVLKGDYPKLLAVIGDAQFHNLATDYLIAHPPDQPSIRDAGAHLPTFVARHALGQQQPWLADLALLERARIEVFDAADTPLLTLDKLRSLRPEEFAAMELRFITAHMLVQAAFAVEEAWQALEAEVAVTAARPWRGQVLVWRVQGTMVYHRRMEPDEEPLVPLLVSGAPFGTICETLCEGRTADDATRLASRLLAEWVGNGMIRWQDGAT